MLHMGQEELPLGGDVELLIEAQPMVLDGAAADAQALGDAGDRMAFQGQADDLPLTMGQWGKPALGRRRGRGESRHLDLVAETAGGGTEIACQNGPDEETAIGQ